MPKRDDARLVLFWLLMVVIAAGCLVASMLSFYEPDALDDPYDSNGFYIETRQLDGR